MGVTGFNHVGILVEDFDVVLGLAQRLGLKVDEPEPEPTLGIEILWVHCDGVRIEFIRPLGEDSRAAEAIRNGQGGVHHIAFTVEGMNPLLAGLADASIVARDGDPMVGHHGATIAFLDTAATAGVRVEFVEPS
ncbi:unannotated protein [freshwater metagenome]|uniref:Unannotated protein n=1 Tax=freshwater metagenome TaxID=449393 RepID=A0A6J7JE57_9ZZZZ|nr:hypothetical protein [Actinomycetota bacterium]